MKSESQKPAKRTKGCKKWGIQRVIEDVDVFGRPLPSFSYKGEEVVHTRAGGVLTILIGGIIMLYALVQFLNLASNKNLNLSIFVDEHHFNKDDKYNLNESNFRIAVAIEGFRKKDMKDDPRFVKWIFRVYGKKDGEEYERILSSHKCK